MRAATQFRQAKADGADPGPDEMQMTQRRYPPLKPGQDPPRTNCRNATDAEGRPFLLCATQVPGEAFYDRQKKLDTQLEKALEELADAERAYRRGWADRPDLPADRNGFSRLFRKNRKECGGFRRNPGFESGASQRRNRFDH